MFEHISRPGKSSSKLESLPLMEKWHFNDTTFAFYFFQLAGFSLQWNFFRFPSHHAEMIFSISPAWLNPPHISELCWPTTQNYVRDITKLLVMWRRTKRSHHFKTTDHEWNMIAPHRRLFLLSKGTEESIPEPQRKERKKRFLLLLGWIELKGKTRLSWQSDSCSLIRQTCKHSDWSSSRTVHARKWFHHRGGSVGGLLSGVVSIATRQECADSAQTWERMSQWSQVLKKKERHLNICSEEICSWSPFPSAFKGLSFGISRGLRTLPDDAL